ncbi:uncharacterized protein LOC131875759 [Cryptomeria japonica]|uniref:uncharacterized protein LOC131875759 n=1 Tax=Cryptomeria japonica TaxID=3369 RepID=UPI0027D9F299|nr:uncharacterized protein LOC131875759 [Cryptomeria japonica]
MALWADRIKVKRAIRKSPFELVYGAKARLLVNNLLPVYKFIHENDLEMASPLLERFEQLAKLDEVGEDAHKRNMKMQQKRKHMFDRRAFKRKFEVDHLVLLWNARAQDKDSYLLANMNGDLQELPVHGYFLKHFFA